MVSVRVTATATVTFSMDIDDEELIDQSIREYVEDNLFAYENDAEVESLEEVEDLEVE